MNHQPPQPLSLRSRPKGGSDHRTLTPEAAFARYRHLVDPSSGLLRDLRWLPAPPGDLVHTCIVKHPMSSWLGALDWTKSCKVGGSSGKGMSRQQAAMSAVGEGLESCSAIWQGYEHHLVTRWKDIQDQALHPHALLGFSPHQYETRAAWNATFRASTLAVPEPFDEDEAMAWVPAWSLRDRRFWYVPARFVFFGYPEDGTPFCLTDSNGLASGATLEEAILHGCYELIERDSVGMWFLNRIHRPGVDLTAFEEPYFAALADYYATALHRELHVLDVTADLGIPCFVALSRRADREPEDIIKGFGCHHDPVVAIGRALTEMNQVMHNVHYENIRSRLDPYYQSWLQQVTFAEHPYLAPDPMQPLRTPADYAMMASDNILVDLKTCLQRIHAVGLSAYVVNLTRAEIEMPVVKVVVPGLLHYWRRLGVDRLYDVPVRMGWRDRPLTETQINPWSIFE